MSFDPPAGLALSAAPRAQIDAALAAQRRPLAERAPSELTFTNLNLFRKPHGWRYLPPPLPRIVGHAYDGTPLLIPLFDLATVPLGQLADLQGAAAWFYPISEPTLAQLGAGNVEIVSNRNDADYVYEAAAFIDYGRPGLASKRAAVARLVTDQRIEATPLDSTSHSEAIEVLEGWCRDKQCGRTDADVPACREALAICQHPGEMRGYLHRVDGRAAGFVVCEEINPCVTAVRFSKGLRATEGIYPAMYQHLVQNLSVRWLNFEQDLGRENFRRSKMSFQPAFLLPKRRVRVR